MTRPRLVLIAALVILMGAAFWFDLGSIITLENFKASQARIDAWVTDRPVTAALTYFIVYIAMAALNIPGAAILTLVGGALFGLLQGTVLVSFASTIGATLAFLLSRYLLRDWVENRFAGFSERINQGIKKDGAFYLFTLRLIPAFPFFVINLVMGLTRMPVLTYYLVSQIGMLPATLIYVNAGTQLSKLETTGDILSPALLGSLILLGVFPLIARFLVNRYKAGRLYRHFKKPSKFDTNMVVIGAGSAGLVTSYIAAAAKAKVTLVERENMGGDCLNTGCVPSKALIRSSRIANYIHRAPEFGLLPATAKADFSAVMRRVQDVIAKIEPHDSIERYTALGVDCEAGSAEIVSPWEVKVGDKTITTRSIVIASGGKPAIPPIPGLDEVDYLTSDTLWDLQELPQRLLVLGGGAIGCELAQAFRRLGSQVTQVEMMPRLLAVEDAPVSAAIEAEFAADGIRVLTGMKVTRFSSAAGQLTATAEAEDGATQDIEFDKVLVATGRQGNTEGLGLENLRFGDDGIELNRNGTVVVNEYLQTAYPNIYACGDVAGPYQLTHAAAHQAWYAAMNALYGSLWKFRVDYSVLPRAVFCDPEVASVGINEQQACEQQLDYDVTEYGIDDLDRAIADGEAHGFVRVITPTGSDKILGVTIVGPHAGDIISEYVLAMRNGLGLGKILGTVHI
ncbi:MAG: FAD-dependent oxidoreductase, partial [Gammaproteobacteria bacterium]|nr:FAD-dependent oxidoreductase [Gammaproteobacteria bacterium]